MLLGRAVECCPAAVDLWLALAHLEPYAEAQKVLNRARRAVPTDRTIWLAAAQLEEAAGRDAAHVDRIVATAIQSLRANSVEINREHWMKDAESCEKGGAPLAAQAIVRTVAGEGVDAEDRRATWLDDAHALVSHGAHACARALSVSLCV